MDPPATRFVSEADGQFLKNLQAKYAGPTRQPVYAMQRPAGYQPGGCSGGKPIWTRGDAGNSVKNAYDHFAKHGTDFPGVQNAKQYVEEATRFINRPPKGTQTIIRNNGDIVLFHPQSNTFAVATQSGVPKTFYKPSGANPLDYFHAQQR